MIRKIASLFFCLGITLVTAPAQSNYAVVRGSILDPQHRPIAGARFAGGKGAGMIVQIRVLDFELSCQTGMSVNEQQAIRGFQVGIHVRRDSPREGSH